MFQNNKKAAFLDYLMIIVGTALMATAINSVFDMSGMVTGGFSGIAILVKEWTEGVVPGGIPLWEKSACHSGWRFFRHLILQEMIFCWQPFMVV